MKRKAWCKLYESWFTSRSHASIPTPDLGIGARLLLIANGEPLDQGVGVLAHPDGSPMSVEDLAFVCKIEVRRMSHVLQHFLRAGTIQRYPSGVYGFPNMERWQSTPSAKRMRRHRQRKAYDETSHNEAKSGVTVTHDVTSPGPSPNESQIDLEEVILQATDKVTRVSESGNGYKTRHSDGYSDGHSNAHVTDRGQRTEIKIRPSDSSPPVPPSSPTRKDKPEVKGSTRVDAVGRIIDFWWHRILKVKPRSRVKPGTSSPAGRRVSAMLRAGFSELDLKQAVEGCFMTPHNMGANDRGELYLGLSLICRDEEQVHRFMHNAEHPPSSPKLHKSRHSDVLENWSKCRSVIDTTAH